MKGKKKNQVITNWKQSNNSKSLKPILQFDIVGNFIKEWNSISEASTTLGINRRNITNNFTNISNSANNYVWRYKN